MSSQEQEENREAITLNALAEAWNVFVLLKSTHPDDLPDFRRAIHECQRILAIRKLRRLDSSTWITHKSSDQCLAAGENNVNSQRH